jgi:hypothetical protein
MKILRQWLSVRERKKRMTCKYAYDAGYSKALDKVREFINREHEKISNSKKIFNSDHTLWWRLQGEQDFILKFYDELGRLMSDKE